MKKIFVAGHKGLVGSAICRELSKFKNVKLVVVGREHLDLCNQKKVTDFLRSERPDEIILAAAKVGGIHANNTYPAEFIYENLQIQNNIINGAHMCDIQKILFLGSSCIYPREAEQPIRESALLSSNLEPTNEPYAIAKIAGIKMCESYNRQYGRDYRSVMPTNLYGPGDNYHPVNSHVLPALIRKFHEAKENRLKEVSIWGTGNPKREFLYVADMAKASVFIHNLSQNVFCKYTKPMLSHINIGTGQDISIKDLSQIVKTVVGFEGGIVFDTSKPDGPMRKLLDVQNLTKLGFRPSTSLTYGIELTYADYVKTIKKK